MWRIRLVWHLISFLGDDTFIVELSYILSIFFDVSHVWHLCLVLGRDQTPLNERVMPDFL